MRPFRGFSGHLLMWFIYIAPYAWRQRRFLLTIYIALPPKGACGSAGWVSNTIAITAVCRNVTHSANLHAFQLFSRQAKIRSIQKIYPKLVIVFFKFSFSLKDSQLEITPENQQALQQALQQAFQTLHSLCYSSHSEGFTSIYIVELET